MTDLILKKPCNICMEDFIPLEQILFFQCGHKACKPCETIHKSNECHICRKPKGFPHRIYLTLDDLGEEQPIQVVEGLNKINVDTPAISVEKACGKIRRLHKRTDGDPATTKALFDATKNLEERVAPLFERFAVAKKENEELVDQLKDLQAKKETYKQRAMKATLIAQKQREERERHSQRAEGYMSVIKDKDAEISRLRQALEERDKKMGLMKTKLKALGKAEKHRSETTQDPNTSLQVEGQLQDPSIKQLKRPSITLLHELNTNPLVSRGKRRKEVISDSSNPKSTRSYSMRLDDP